MWFDKFVRGFLMSIPKADIVSWEYVGLLSGMLLIVVVTAFVILIILEIITRRR